MWVGFGCVHGLASFGSNNLCVILAARVIIITFARRQLEGKLHVLLRPAPPGPSRPESSLKPSRTHTMHLGGQESMSTSAISVPSGAALETTPLLTVARHRYHVHSVVETSSASESSSGSDMVDITKDRYDLTTFKGRVQHFASVTSPLTLLASNAELKSAQELVQAYEAKFPANRKTGTYFVPKQEAQKYWKAKQLVDSSVHPDTGEVILLPFRMAAFVPTNLLVVGGMLMPNPSLAGIVFWQWVNQSLNVAVNYSNANKSVPMNMKEVGFAYAAATTSAVGIAVGMNRGVPKLRVSPGVKGVLTSLVPFVSVASAGMPGPGATPAMSGYSLVS